MEDPLAVSEEALASLSGGDAEDLVRRMILAEADSAGVRIDQIYDGGRPSSPDKGVDFEVRDAPRNSANMLIRKGHTLYQVKSGSVSPSGAARDILFDSGGGLRGYIRESLEAGGTLVVVATKPGGSSTARSGLEEKLIEELAGRLPPRGDAPVKVWTSADVRSMLERYPHLAFSVGTWRLRGLRTHDEWSSLADMSHTFRPGDGEGEFIKRLRGCLLGDRPVQVRVTGEPGSGKTRLVLEATRDKRLASRVVYAEGYRLLRPLLDRISLGGTGGCEGTIIVVDDCSRPDQETIWNEIEDQHRIWLVAIHGDEAEADDDAIRMPVPPLADAQLREIISAYTEADDDGVAPWVEYCRASPRAAHIVGASLRANPGDLLRAPGRVDVWDRYIAGKDDPGGDESRTRRTVLEWLSLFKTFGDWNAYGPELDRIAELVEKREGVPTGRFTAAIAELKSMKVLQGSSMLYITPKLLHLHLWAEWWRKHPPSMAPGPDQLTGGGEDGSGGPRRLLRWYLDMFRYARDSSAASKAVRDMMKPGGILDSDSVLKSKLGADFFLALSPADPTSSLACMGRIIDRSGGGLGRAHPKAVCALARLLAYEGAFAGSMRLLLRLAVAAGGVDTAREYAPNPALDAYCRALDPARENGAAPLPARLAALEGAMRSASDEERRVGVRACRDVLSMHRRSIALPRTVGFGHLPEPWTPGDRGGLIGYYLAILGHLGAASLGPASGGVRREAAAAVVGTMRQTVLVPELSEPVALLLGRMAASNAVDKEVLADQIGALLDVEGDRIGPRASELLASMRDSIEGTGFSVELRRQAGRHARHGDSDRTERALRRLADAAAADGGALLAPELGWLAACGAHNCILFGREVGARDPDLRMLGRILDAMRDAGPRATALFLSGYLLPAAGSRRGDLEGLLDRMMDDGDLCAHVPAVTWRTGMTERAAERLARGVSSGRLGVDSLQTLRYGHRLRGASAGAVARLAAAVLEARGQESKSGATALDLVHSRFVSGPGAAGIGALPDGLALAVLLHDTLLGAAAGGEPPDPVVCGAWKDLAAAVARQGGRDALALAEAMIDRFESSALLHAPGSEPPSAALAEIAVRRPREVWGMIAARLGAPRDRRALALLEWLKKGGASRAVGAERLVSALVPWIVEWVGEDPDGRAEEMSRHLPHAFPAIRAFLARFGGREDVRSLMAVNFASGAYRGSAVSYYADLKKRAQRLAEGETDRNVLSCLGHYAEFLENRMEEAVAAG